MKWILVLMIWGAGTADSFSVSTVPHKFSTELECKTFVAQLRLEHERKRIDASCIPVADQPMAQSAKQQ